MDDLISRAAAILIAERYGCNNGSALGHHSGVADCIASEITTLPAVDAIPVEWIRAQVDNEKRAPLFRRYAEALLTIWQKEQEAQDG